MLPFTALASLRSEWGVRSSCWVRRAEFVPGCVPWTASRTSGGLCRIGRHAIVASHFPHFGEEDCLRGWNGSGTIFFAGCNLRCVFCQNYGVSWEVEGREAPPERLAAMRLELQEIGCHNINWVTPEHVVPQILEALPLAVGGGLRLLIVRHLVMPGLLDETEDVLRFVASSSGPAP